MTGAQQHLNHGAALNQQQTHKINCLDKRQKCFSSNSHFITIHRTALCLFCSSDTVKLAENRWVLSRCQTMCVFAARVCMCVRAGRGDRLYSCNELFLRACVANYSRDICTNLSFLPGRGAVQLSYVQTHLLPVCVCAGLCVCVCVLLCRCLRVDVPPVTRAFGEQSGGEDSRAIGRP